MGYQGLVRDDGDPVSTDAKNKENSRGLLVLQSKELGMIGLVVGLDGESLGRRSREDDESRPRIKYKININPTRMMQ